MTADVLLARQRKLHENRRSTIVITITSTKVRQIHVSFPRYNMRFFFMHIFHLLFCVWMIVTVVMAYVNVCKRARMNFVSKNIAICNICKLWVFFILLTLSFLSFFFEWLWLSAYICSNYRVATKRVGWLFCYRFE